ncbi:MAG: TerC family protein [Rhodothermales bacterium]
MEWLSSPEAWIALVTLTALELVLGIDNIIFISILAGKLPPDQRNRARLVGLGLAMISRLALLFSLAWVIQLTAPWFTVLGNEISGRDFILIVGGFFLIAKSTHEIHQKLEGDEAELSVARAPSFQSVIIQIMLLDVVFSLDSVITAVGMVSEVGIMVTAVVIAVGFMMLFAKRIGDFVERRPTIKILALSFLLLIGFTLIADGLDHHVPKGYIYTAMGFSVFVEMINLRVRKKKPAVEPVRLREPYVRHGSADVSEGDR